MSFKMDRIGGFWIVLLLALCFGCVNQHQRVAEFNPAEYQPFEGEGTGAVEGQAFLTTRGGDVKFGAGRTVFMNPKTTYSSEWYWEGVVGGAELSPVDSRAGRYTRSTVADGEGRFRFDGLPPGDYYLACNITWEIPGQYYTQTTGGTAHAEVRVEEGETVRVVVTR